MEDFGFGLFDTELVDSKRDAAIASALQNCVPSCSVRDFDSNFLDVLYSVWRLQPFTISSGFRSVDYERSRGRSGKSSHCKGLAADIVCLSNRERFFLVSHFLSFGINRIGIAKNFIHVDLDGSLPEPRIWTYDDKNKERR